MNWRIWASGLALGVAMTGCGKSNKKPEVAVTPTETTSEPDTADFSKLASALKSSRPDRLQSAIDMAVRFDQDEEDPIPTLLAALNDPTCAALGETSNEKPYSSREAAVIALLKLGPKGKSALMKDGIKSLRTGLSDSKPAVREHSVNAFVMMKEDAKAYLNDIAPLTADPEAAVRSAAYRALEKSKTPATEIVLKLLVSEDVVIATEAAVSMSVNKVNSPSSIPFLVAALKRKAPENFSGDQLTFIKSRAAEALAGLGDKAIVAIPELIDLVQKVSVDEIEKMTRPAGPNDRTPPPPGHILALRRIGVGVLPSVVPLLKNDQAIVRYQAALVLSGLPFRAETEKVLPEVLEALVKERGLPSGQMYVFEELFKASVRYKAKPEPLVEQLLELLSNESDAVRFRSIALFKTLEAKAVSALPKLREKLSDPEPLIQIAVLDAIKAIGPAAKDASEDVGKLVDSMNQRVSRAALSTLKEISGNQSKSITAVIKLLSSNDRNVVIEAAQTIGSFGAGGSEAVEALTKILAAPTSHLEERRAILETLIAIGAGAKSATSTVVNATADKDIQTRVLAVSCLGAISPFSEDVRKVAAERLLDSNSQVRIATLKMLAGYGGNAKSSVADIHKMMNGTKAPELKIWCAATLVTLGDEETANSSVVFDAMKPKNQLNTRFAAFDALAVMGSKAKPATQELLSALQDKTPAAKAMMSLREKALITCGRLPGITKPAITTISDMLKDSDKQIRKTAIQVIAAYGPDAVIAVPKLQEIIDSNDRELRELAKKSLSKIAIEPNRSQSPP